MEEHNVTGLRDALEQMPGEQLRDMLQAELEKEAPDPDAVRLILSVLEAREADSPVKITPEEEKAWQRYRHRAADRVRKPAQLRRWVTVAASAAVVFGLLFMVVPQSANAESFWAMLQRWSDSLLEIINPGESISSLEYSFETDNPGLQQVYDAVVELGVTDPVVPMWLPEGYEILELETKSTPVLNSIFAWFVCDDGEMVYKLDVYTGEPAHQYYKDDSHYETYERDGATYNITRNNDRWVVVWTKDNIECSLALDCQEDTLRRILRSIYAMEDN